MVMSIRSVPFLFGEYYHIYNRGVDKRTIFLGDHDYKRFQALLYLCNSTKTLDIKGLLQGKALESVYAVDRGDALVDIIIYCLMPNHFHILVREKTEGGVSKFMQRLSTAYSMYFNSKYERSGTLFEGKFKAKHIDNEAYFMWIFSYIHLNIVKLIDPTWKENGIQNIELVADFVKSYKYSSYYDYFVGERIESVILNKEAAPEYIAQLDDIESLANQFNEGRTID